MAAEWRNFGGAGADRVPIRDTSDQYFRYHRERRDERMIASVLEVKKEIAVK